MVRANGRATTPLLLETFMARPSKANGFKCIGGKTALCAQGSFQLYTPYNEFRISQPRAFAEKWMEIFVRLRYIACQERTALKGDITCRLRTKVPYVSLGASNVRTCETSTFLAEPPEINAIAAPLITSTVSREHTRENEDVVSQDRQSRRLYMGNSHEPALL